MKWWVFESRSRSKKMLGYLLLLGKVFQVFSAEIMCYQGYSLAMPLCRKEYLQLSNYVQACIIHNRCFVRHGFSWIYTIISYVYCLLFWKFDCSSFGAPKTVHFGVNRFGRFDAWKFHEAFTQWKKNGIVFIISLMISISNFHITVTKARTVKIFVPL